MQVIDVGQEGYDWHNFRRLGIGSSDAPIIMGVNKKGLTVKQLLEQKRAKDVLVDEEKGNFILERGKRLEPRMRAMLILQTGIEFEPKCAINAKHSWLRASLDGLSRCQNFIAEFKYSGKDNFELLKEKRTVPPEHWPQVQHGLMVTKARLNYYAIGILPKKNAKGKASEQEIELTYLAVEPDMKYMLALFEKEKAFWELVTAGGEIGLSKGDIVKLEQPGLSAVVHEWRMKSKAFKKAKKEFEEVDENFKEIIAKGSHTHYDIYGVDALLVESKGNVDYKKVPELKGVDLEPYRGKPRKYWKLSDDGN